MSLEADTQGTQGWELPAPVQTPAIRALNTSRRAGTHGRCGSPQGPSGELREPPRTAEPQSGLSLCCCPVWDTAMAPVEPQALGSTHLPSGEAPLPPETAQAAAKPDSDPSRLDGWGATSQAEGALGESRVHICKEHCWVLLKCLLGKPWGPLSRAAVHRKHPDFAHSRCSEKVGPLISVTTVTITTP